MSSWATMQLFHQAPHELGPLLLDLYLAKDAYDPVEEVAAVERLFERLVLVEGMS